MRISEGEHRLSSLERVWRRKAEEERRWIYWTKDVEDVFARQEERGTPQMGVGREDMKMVGVIDQINIYNQSTF